MLRSASVETRPTEKRREWIAVALVVACLVPYAAFLASSLDLDPIYRTLFIEEMHNGEAGRTRYLFGAWHGEGGRWQSMPFAPLPSILSWLSFTVFGLGIVELRVPYLLATILSLVLFARCAFREAPTGASAFTVFLCLVLSPFFNAMRPTSNGELLYPVAACLLILVLQQADRQFEPRHRDWWLACAGFVAGATTLIKIDSFVIPLALVCAAAVWTLSGRMSLRSLVAIALGGAISCVLLVGVIMTTTGLQAFVEMVRWTAEIAPRRLPAIWASMPARLENIIFKQPMNLELFLPGQTALVTMAMALGIARWRRLSLTTLFCLAVVTLGFLWAGASPLVYWRKVALFVVPALVLIAAVLLDGEPVAEQRSRGFLAVLAAAAFALQAIMFLSHFNGMWRIVLPWSAPGASAIVWLGMPAAAAFAAAILAWQLGSAFLRAAFYAMMSVTIVSGLVQVTTQPKERDAYEIGEAIGRLLDGKTVVSDMNGFRFAGYHTNARFRYFQENDPEFPQGIYDEARRLHPDFILVTDSYGKISPEIPQRFPDYKLVASYRYSHSPKRFDYVAADHAIFLYRRVEGSNAETRS